MPFTLGTNSKAKLQGVHPNLVKVVERAIAITKQDFTVNEGLRTAERQRQLVAKGASQTMNSKHIKQSSGYGHAVDLCAWGDFDGNGKSEISWDMKHYYPIANAMRQAANELGVTVRWGGCWKVLNGTTQTVEKLVADYVAERKKQGKKAFIDAVHFELM